VLILETLLQTASSVQANYNPVKAEHDKIRYFPYGSSRAAGSKHPATDNWHNNSSKKKGVLHFVSLPIIHLANGPHSPYRQHNNGMMWVSDCASAAMVTPLTISRSYGLHGRPQNTATGKRRSSFSPPVAASTPPPSTLQFTQQKCECWQPADSLLKWHRVRPSARP
jgi:hypothetical protein